MLCIIGYNTVDEAVRIANDTPYGLAGVCVCVCVCVSLLTFGSGYVQGASQEVVRSIARRLRAGNIAINGAPMERLARSCHTVLVLNRVLVCLSLCLSANLTVYCCPDVFCLSFAPSLCGSASYSCRTVLAGISNPAMGVSVGPSVLPLLSLFCHVIG